MPCVHCAISSESSPQLVLADLAGSASASQVGLVVLSSLRGERIREEEIGAIIIDDGDVIGEDIECVECGIVILPKNV